MQVAVRPRVKAGIAIVGASALAITPIAVAPPDVKLPTQAISSAAVALKANPITFYTEVIERSLDNTQALAEILLSNPVPILQQVLANQFANVENLVAAVGNAAEGIVTALTEQVPGELQTAFDELLNGNVEGALNTLLAIPLTFALPLLDVLGAVVTPIMNAVANFNTVVQDVFGAAILGGALAFAGPVLSGIGSVGTAIQGVIDAVGSGDLGAIGSALVNIPAVIADGVLNGGYGPLLLGILPAPGLLTAEGLLGPLGAGPIGFLLGLRQAIADAIAPTTMLARSGAPEAGEDEGLQAANSLLNSDANLVNIDTSGAGSGAGDTEGGEGTGGGEGAGGSGENGAGGDGLDGLDGEDGGDGDLNEGDVDEGDSNGATDLTSGNKVEPGHTAGSGDGTDGGGDGSAEETTSTESTPSNDGGDGDGDGGDGTGGEGGGSEE